MTNDDDDLTADEFLGRHAAPTPGDEAAGFLLGLLFIVGLLFGVPYLISLGWHAAM